VVFLVSAGHTRKASAKAALKRLRQAGVQPIGAIMTKLSARDGAYGYYQSYYYYRSTNDSPQLEKAQHA
jgi:Mrp family chromosome partitioning ATPase